MSAIPVTPVAPAAARRPGVLVAAVGAVVVTALAALVNGVLIVTGGRGLVRDLLVQAGMPASVTEADLDTFAELAGEGSFDGIVSTFATRGWTAAGAGAALLVFGLLMVKGAATWARVLVTISAALTVVFSLVILGDETTTTMAGLATLAVLGAIVAVVCTWLPANGRYATALRA